MNVLVKISEKDNSKNQGGTKRGSYDSDYIAAILMVHQLNKAIQMAPPPELNAIGKAKFWFIKMWSKYVYSN